MIVTLAKRLHAWRVPSWTVVPALIVGALALYGAWYAAHQAYQTAQLRALAGMRMGSRDTTDEQKQETCVVELGKPGQLFEGQPILTQIEGAYNSFIDIDPAATPFWVYGRCDHLKIIGTAPRHDH